MIFYNFLVKFVKNIKNYWKLLSCVNKKVDEKHFKFFFMEHFYETSEILCVTRSTASDAISQKSKNLRRIIKM